MAARRYGEAYADNALSFPPLSPSNRVNESNSLIRPSTLFPHFPNPATITRYLPRCPVLSRYSIMELRSAWLAVSILLGSSALLMGLVSCVSSHFAMLARSYLRTWGRADGRVT